MDDPFPITITQDDFKKIEEALQSEQGRAILRETTTSHVRGEDSAIINSSMESLGLSDSDIVENLALDPATEQNFFTVPNDEDVVNIATDILHSNIPKTDAEQVLMEHCYSLPMDTPRFDILNVEKQVGDTSLGTEGDNESTDSANSPLSVHGTFPNPTKIEEGQMDLAYSGVDVKYDRNANVKRVSENQKLPYARTDLREKHSGIEVPSIINESGNHSYEFFIGSTKTDLSTVNQMSDKGKVHMPVARQTRSAGKARRRASQSVSEEKSWGASDQEQVHNKLVDQSSTHSDDSPSVTNETCGIVSKERRSRNLSAPSDESKQTQSSGSERELPISGRLLSKHGFGIISKNDSRKSAKSKAEELRSVNTRLSPEKHGAEKRIRRPSVKLEDFDSKSAVSLEGRKKSVEKKNISHARKKSLSISEDAAEMKSESGTKRRRMSSGSSTGGLPDPNSSMAGNKMKAVRPKKKVVKNDSISADLLGPALFSEPDVMVKVKTDDSSDDKGDSSMSPMKSNSVGGSGAQTTLTEKTQVSEPGSKTLSELDMIKAEVNQKDPDEMSNAVPSDVFLLQPEASSVKNNISEDTESDKNAFITDLPSAPDKASLGEKDKVGSNDLVLVRNSEEREACSEVGDSSNFENGPVNEVTAPGASVRTRRSNNRCIQQDVPHPPEPSSSPDIQHTSNKENKLVGNISFPPVNTDAAKNVEVVRPERKSQRIHKKRKIFEDDESPERQKRERKSLPNKTAENQKKTQKNKKNTENKAKREEPEEGDEAEEDDPEDSDWDSEDDPEKLWCICRQPHNNKFMIQCDKCKDWFHGTCVSVTRQAGRQLEKEGREWICPVCNKGNVGKTTKESPASKDIKITERTSKRPSQGTPKKSGALAITFQQEKCSKPLPIITPSLRRNEVGDKPAAVDVRTPQSNSNAPKENKLQIDTQKQKDLNDDDNTLKKARASERVTRNAIPKNYILKSRDIPKRETDKQNPEPKTVPIKTEAVKREGSQILKSELNATKSLKMTTRAGRTIVKTDVAKFEEQEKSRLSVSSAKEMEGKVSTQKDLKKCSLQKDTVKLNIQQKEVTKSNVLKEAIKPGVQRINKLRESSTTDALIKEKSLKEKSTISAKKPIQSAEKEKRTMTHRAETNLSKSKESAKPSSLKTVKSDASKKKMTESPLRERKVSLRSYNMAIHCS